MAPCTACEPPPTTYNEQAFRSDVPSASLPLRRYSSTSFPACTRRAATARAFYSSDVVCDQPRRIATRGAMATCMAESCRHKPGEQGISFPVGLQPQSNRRDASRTIPDSSSQSVFSTQWPNGYTAPFHAAAENLHSGSRMKASAFMPDRCSRRSTLPPTGGNSGILRRAELREAWKHLSGRVYLRRRTEQ